MSRLLGSILLVALLALSTAARAYDYPVRDPYLATVVGTSRANQPELPDRYDYRVRRIPRFTTHAVPSAFWDQERFRFGLSRQDGPAPLIFLVAGTGASHTTEKMIFLHRVFHDAGYHVVGLASPTHPNFILTGSTSGMPGSLPEDSADLYAAMKIVRHHLRDAIEVTDYYLAGYSLGGSQSAFIAMLDSQAGADAFGFRRVLMINPAVSLYSSIRILDGMFDSALPDGDASVSDLFERLLTAVTEHFHAEGRPRLDEELLYEVAERRTAEGRPPRREALQGMIAAVFRLASASLVFTSDAVHGGGHVVEPGKRLRATTSLTPGMNRSLQWSFERYLDEMLLPYWKEKQPGLDRQTLIDRASLVSIRGYLAADPRIGVMTNADDFILAEGELDFLRQTFGERAIVFPHGGHCGNMTYRENVETMLDFLDGSVR